MSADGLVLRVRWCSACGTYYGAMYRPDLASVADKARHICEHCCRPCQFLDHWPRFLCPVPALQVPELSNVAWTGYHSPALGPAQQELGF